jgi:hypothetical protein
MKFLKNLHVMYMLVGQLEPEPHYGVAPDQQQFFFLIHIL